MARDEICICGHFQSTHRTYGCTVSKPNPDANKKKNAPDRIFCQCKAFQVTARKAAHAG